MPANKPHIPVGTQALILSKYYYGVLSKRLENLDIDRYFSVLYFLHANNGCSQQYICNNLAIDKTAMVKVLNYLLKAGYVERNVNPKDRREHFILLTKKGLKKTQEVVKEFESIDKQIFANINKEDKNTFIKLLSTLGEILKEIPGNDLFFNYNKTKKDR